MTMEKNSWFKQKTNLVKCLIVLVAAILIILVALLTNLVIRKDDFICKTENCIRTSAEIIRYLDQTANPCTDFHAFACGNFMENVQQAPPPPPEDELDAMITEMAHLNESKSFIMQKTFYQTCMNLAGIEMDQDKTLLDYFEALGSWPLLRGVHNWDGAYFEWTNVVLMSRQFGFRIDWYLDFRIFADVNDTQNLLRIDVPRDLRSISPAEKTLRINLMYNIVVFWGAPVKDTNYYVEEVLHFEEAIAEAADKHRKRVKVWGESSHTKLTIKKLQEQSPNILWLQLINNITGQQLSESDYVIMDAIDYLKDLYMIIMDTPKSFMVSYMMWKIVEDVWPYLSRPIREYFERYYFDVHKVEPQSSRSRFCIGESKKQFPLIAEAAYIRRHVTEQKRELVREMIYMIRKEVTRLLEDAYEMHRELKQRALDRVQQMKILIGGPEEIYNRYAFEENVGVYGFIYKFTNIIEMLNERRIQLYNKYFSTMYTPLMNNTVEYYEKVINISRFTTINNDTIVIPAAVLRDIFFNPQLPNYLNYATLGRALAREIVIHIFKRNATADHRYYHDNQHEKYFKCLLKDSLNFPTPDFKRPKTMRDSLVEVAATDLALEAYRESRRMQPQELMLPGLKFTPNQLFWIETSKFSCSKIYKKHDRDNSRFKIIGPLRNSRNFAKDFNCPQRSKMNPEKKCRVL